MIIWFFSAYDQPRGHSSRTYDFSLELKNRGHKVTMFTNSYCHWTHQCRLKPSEKWRIEDIDGIRVIWLRTIHYIDSGMMRGLNMVSNAWRCIQVSRILQEKPDVVVGPSVPLLTGWAASIVAEMKEAAFVFEVRDIWPLALVESGGLSKKNSIYYVLRYLEKFLYRTSQRISSALPFVYKHISESSADPEKVIWIPNGINFERFSGFETYDGGVKNRILAMYVGGFGAEHDVMTIVRAANILKNKGNNRYKFVIVGNGPKRLECEMEASLNKLSNIEFRDPVAKSDVPKLQMEADVLVASIIDSGVYRFGLNLNKLYDYFASGRPVIFSGKAPNDLVAEAGSGFSIPPEEPEAMARALEKMIEMSPTERIDMGKRGRKYIETKFDMSVLGDRMEELLLIATKDKGL